MSELLTSSGYGYGDGYGDGDKIGSIAGRPVTGDLRFGVLRVGCQCHTIEHWREHWREIADNEGVSVTAEEVEKFLGRKKS